jgi:hypothetical protein
VALFGENYRRLEAASGMMGNDNVQMRTNGNRH